MAKKIDRSELKKSNPVFTLSVASRLSDLPMHSIRQYVDKGLIIPFRKESNRNLFSKVDILRLKNIRYQLEEQGLNIAGIKALLAFIPCWSIRGCSEKDRESCQGYYSITQPCWEASGKGALCRNQDCRECDVYCILEKIQDLKQLFRELIN